MQSKYQRRFWPIILADVILLIIIIVKGPAAYQKLAPKVAEIAIPTPAATATVRVDPIKISVLFPDNIIEQRDFPLTLLIQNTGTKAIRISDIVLPRIFADSMVFKQSDPVFSQRNSDATGDSYPVNETIQPNSDRSYIFIFKATKMQAFNEEIIIHSDSGDLTGRLMLAVAPDMKSQPFVDEAYPFQAVVRITAMYKDANGLLQPGWSGLGSLITSDGLILTNAHTVLPNRSLPVDGLMVSLIQSQDLPPQDRYYAEVIQADYYLDLAVIRIVADLQENPLNPGSIHLPVVEIGDPNRITLGKRLAILGLPLTGRELVTQINGDISGFVAQTPYGDKAFIQTSAKIPASFVGGMALDDHGKLLAITALNVSPKGVVGASDCLYLADSNSDRKIDSKDMCMPSEGAVTGLRPIDLALPMITAAKNGEEKIYGYPHDLIKFPAGSRVQLEEKFPDKGTGWVNASTKAKYGTYEQTAYQFNLSAPGQLGLSYYENKRFTDTVTNSLVMPVTSSDDAFFAGVCRYTNIENYYLFMVTTDGRYSIQKVENDQFSVLVPWTYSPIIPVKSDLKLNIACVEKTLSLGVNGIPLAQVNNASHWRGLPGLAAGTFRSGQYAVAFDDLVIMTP
jgi:S1-C subfamily serine protease